MTLFANPRLRALLIVCVLALSAMAAGMMVLGRLQSASGTTSQEPAAPPAAVPSLVPSAPVPPKAGSPTTPAAPAGDQLPRQIADALASNRVVVVALYAPNAKIDTVAMREADAGAQLAGAVFVPIDVTKSDVDNLNKRYGAIHDPAVLVLRPPGDLIVRIDGFADRDTVAQAAANAAS